MDGTHVPIATAAITAVRPKRLCRAAIPPKIGFASSNRMLVSPSTTYFHSRWMGDANSAYRPADAAACSSSARIRATLRWPVWTGNLWCGLAGPEGWAGVRGCVGELHGHSATGLGYLARR